MGNLVEFKATNKCCYNCGIDEKQEKLIKKRIANNESITICESCNDDVEKLECDGCQRELQPRYLYIADSGLLYCKRCINKMEDE